MSTMDIGKTTMVMQTTDIETVDNTSAIELDLFRHIQHEKKRRFLKAYIECCGRINVASEVVGIDRTSHYFWLNSDPEYADAFQVAYKIACDNIEAEAKRRGIDGVTRPVYQQGKLVGYTQEYSDTMLAMLLNGHLPDKYKQRREITGVMQLKAYQDVDLDKV